jgi:hypothetical protein
MSASYATDHAGAYADILAAGAAVSFSAITAGTYDGATDTWSTPSTTTVGGVAMRVRGNSLTYQALELVQSEAPTLLFAPSTYGATPALGMTVEWDGVVYTVRSVEPVAPSGDTVIARVVVAK